jgi:hypothetical protein
MRHSAESELGAICGIARNLNSAVCGTARSRFSVSNRIELLRQFESIFKPALAHESGDPEVPGRKSRETVPTSGMLRWQCR